MKKIILYFVFSTAGFLSLPMFSQIENRFVALDMPGDNLNLYAVLDVFQNSKTLEEFERALNSKDNLNNLDLNNDNFIDYIDVVSFKNGDSYSIVLRIALNNIEFQDVAVIAVNKNIYGRAVVQIIGDEELYGKDYILEPSAGDGLTPNPGFLGYERTYSGNYWNGMVYVNDWPIIIHLFSPSFVAYVSPWRWGYYPSYWRRRIPIFYYDYWGYHRHYYRNNFYRRVGYVRYPYAYSNYYSRRNSSPIVTRNRINNVYRDTYQGRTFGRPQGTVLPRTQEQIRGSRSVNPRTVRPVQPAAPTNRQPAQRTRQQNPPSVRPTPPVNRQSAPRSNNPTRTRNRN
ncbi:hypothetical protein [Flavobacterium caseinilyticum]|uniref:DUF3300 domain-containing protein n=1 Tax=Flavobacterium caseinilyticum TaxID=2541732 RepID=A0A4R5ATQ7_9FLAO|nr:hypothetical protein [Flavobacterium caseinilyticum]TDD75219.1 hypothetical protein E0F89_12615 [Flavobacterium caseinilyticum]